MSNIGMSTRWLANISILLQCADRLGLTNYKKWVGQNLAASLEGGCCLTSFTEGITVPWAQGVDEWGRATAGAVSLELVWMHARIPGQL